MTSSIVETNSGKQLAVRVDNSFLCECGCGKRVKGNKRFFSHACYGRYMRNTKSRQKTPKISKCQWCKEIISEGERYCSDKCKKIDYQRRGWGNQSFSNNTYPDDQRKSLGGEKAI